ncbi:MAG: hypothetical protein WA153_02935, partial [Candidatus Acidiferrales bacterium]
MPDAPTRATAKNLCPFSDAFPTPAQHFTRDFFFSPPHRDNRCIQYVFDVRSLARKSKAGNKEHPNDVY